MGSHSGVCRMELRRGSDRSTPKEHSEPSPPTREEGERTQASSAGWETCFRRLPEAMGSFLHEDSTDNTQRIILESTLV